MSRDMYPLNVVLERFAGVVGVSLGHSSESTFCNCLLTTRKKSRETSWSRWPPISERPDQLDDYAKFGKNAATHHFVEGPFFTVYQWFKIILRPRFLGERFNSIHSGRDWNWYSGELGAFDFARDSKIIDFTICILLRTLIQFWKLNLCLYRFEFDCSFNV